MGVGEGSIKGKFLKEKFVAKLEYPGGGGGGGGEQEQNK